MEKLLGILQDVIKVKRTLLLAIMACAKGHLLAEALKNVPLDLAISSPLRRSLQTCSFCAELHSIPVLTDARLLEINHGLWEGVLAPEIQKQYPVEFATWHTHPEQVQMPQGENLEAVRRRVR